MSDVEESKEPSKTIFVNTAQPTNEVVLDSNVEYSQSPHNKKGPRNWEIRIKLFADKNPMIEVITANELHDVIAWIKKYYEEWQIEFVKLRQLRRVDISWDKVYWKRTPDIESCEHDILEVASRNPYVEWEFCKKCGYDSRIHGSLKGKDAKASEDKERDKND